MNETKKTIIVRHLRLLWLHSWERSEAMKHAHYSCELCGKKQSRKKGFKQKVEVHHKKGVGNWDKVVDAIREEILCDPAFLQVLCPECHGSMENDC